MRKFSVRKWEVGVAAVFDWEFAFSGSLLVDVGHFSVTSEEARTCANSLFAAAVNFFDGVDCATGDWVLVFATCAWEQPINERPMTARTSV